MEKLWPRGARFVPLSGAVSEPLSHEPPFRKAAVRLTCGLLLLFGLVVAHTVYDHFHREQLEDVAALTGVGDARWYKIPNPEPNPPIAAAIYGGQPLVPLSYRKIDLRDVRMTFVGGDDAHTLRVYSTREADAVRPGEVERKGEPVYYLKTGPDLYLKVQPKGR
jgi:hypothetical protein